MTPPAFILVVLAALGALGLAGLWLVFTGWRGVVVDRLTRCARCGFDLTGVYTKGSPDQRCPECGGALDQGRRPVTDAFRTRRPRRMIAGVLVLVPALVLGAGLFSKQLSVPKVIAGLPTSAVTRVTSLRFGVGAFELTRRVWTERLTKADIASAIEAALAVQADHSRPWDPVWGDLVEMARAKGLVTDEDWTAYAKGSVWISMRTREAVTTTSLFPVRLTSHAARVANRSTLRLVVKIGVPAPVGHGHRLDSEHKISTLIPGTPITGGATFAPGLPQGEHTVEIPTEVSVAEGVAQTAIPGTTVAQVFRRAVTVHTDVASIVRSVPNPALHNPILAALSIDDLKLTANTSGQMLSGVVRLTNLRDPVRTHMAFNVFLRVPSAKSGGPTDLILLGRVLRRFESPGGRFSSMFGQQVPAGLSGEVDFVLRSDPEVALGMLDVDTIWEGELVLEGIALPPLKPK
ncbi:MAG: hypothetical protein ACT4PL_02785 [Phycisphaerales bacterium]